MPKGKVPQKRVTSPDIQNKIAAFIEREGKMHDIPVYVDNPPAERYGKSGRPDLFIDWGHLHFRIEVKARANEEPSDNQQSYQRRDGLHLFGRTFSVQGMTQCNYFIANFHTFMAMLMAATYRANASMAKLMQNALLGEQVLDVQVPDLMHHVTVAHGAHMVNANRLRMKGDGLAKMWDDTHIEPDLDSQDEMDTPA